MTARAAHYAHSLEGEPRERWHELQAHLTDTAARAEAFCSSFAPGWGRLAGLWHDAGKYRDAFQQRLEDPEAHCRVDHSAVGALIALERRVHPLAFLKSQPARAAWIETR